jgi:hypothetical protein
MEEQQARPGAPSHMSASRKSSPRLLLLAGLLLAAVGGGAAAVLLSGDDGDGGVLLLPAASPGRADFTGDLDLLAADRRARPDGERPSLPFDDLDQPVAQAGLQIRGAEAGLYTATRDEPTCDVEALAERLVGDDAATTATAWFAAVARSIDEDGRDDYLEDLTALRLRVDTRVVAHGFVDGEAAPYPAVLQAGTAVLVDETGVPRVRCTGGTPLREVADADGSGDGAAASEDAEPANPGDAWPGFDPAAVVVVEARLAEDGFEVAGAGGPDAEGDTTFVRATGSNGDRDRGVFDPDDGEPIEACTDGCHVLEIALASGGATLTFEGVAQPDEVDDQRLFWRQAEPTTYKFTVAQPWKVFGQYGPGDELPPPPWDDPAAEGEEIMLETADPTSGVPVNRLVECIPGPVSITITVDGQIARTLDEDVSCIGTVDLEFVLE